MCDTLNVVRDPLLFWGKITFSGLVELMATVLWILILDTKYHAFEQNNFKFWAIQFL